MNFFVKDLEPSLNLTHNGVDILKKQFKAGTKEQISENRVVKEGDKYLGTEPERKSRTEYKSRTVYQTGEFRINNIKESKDEFDSTQFIVLAKDLVLEADQSKQEVCQEDRDQVLS